MNKKQKIRIVVSASIATSLGLAVTWFANHMRYEEYSKTEQASYIKRYGQNPSALSEKKLAEAMGVIDKNLAMAKCLNRYRKENHSFAPALTACKQELLFDP